MFRQVVVVAAVAGAVLTGCGTAKPTEDRFTTKQVGGATCIVFQPYDGSGNGINMQCHWPQDGK